MSFSGGYSGDELTLQYDDIWEKNISYVVVFLWSSYYLNILKEKKTFKSNMFWAGPLWTPTTPSCLCAGTDSRRKKTLLHLSTEFPQGDNWPHDHHLNTLIPRLFAALPSIEFNWLHGPVWRCDSRHWISSIIAEELILSDTQKALGKP